MFKKPFKISTQHTLSNKDRKKLKQELHNQFDRDTVDKFFEYGEKLDQQKLEKSKILIFVDETDPLIVDSTSNKDYFPTVYCLNLFPDFVKLVFELKEGVEKFLQKGAQLMWPGVQNFDSLPDFKIDEVVAIRTSTGNFIAVGALACSKKELDITEKKEGIAAYILHVEGDTLYEAGSRDPKKPVFRKPIVQEQKDPEETEETEVPDKKASKNNDDDENEDIMAFYKEVNKHKTNTQIKTQNLKKGPQTFSTKGKAAKKNDDDFDNDDHPKQKNPKKNTKEPSKGKAKADIPKKDDAEENEEEDEDDDQSKSKEGTNVSTKDMDAKILEAFLNCLIMSLTDEDLPIENANLWNNHVLPCRPHDSTVDLKYSSYKKLGKFFSSMDKLGFITYKEASKKSSTPQITAIHRKNQKISDWEPTISAPISKESDDKEKPTLKHDVTQEIVNLCKPDSLLKKYLNVPPNVEFIRHEEMEKGIRDFLKKANLLQKDSIIVSEALKDDFHINLDDDDDEADENKDEDQIKEDKTKEEEVNKKEKKKATKSAIPTIKLTKFMQLLSKHLTYVYKIIDLKTKKEITKQGKFEGITVYAEKAHNKFITRIAGLGVYGINLDSLLTEWQIKFATSGTIHEAVLNKAHIKEITLQGTFPDEIKEYLNIVLKIPEDMVNIVNKVDKKKKKKQH